MRLSTLTLLSSVLFGVSHGSLYGESNLNHTCQLRLLHPPLQVPCSHRPLETPDLSCSKEAFPNTTDSCCTETFGGLVLSTQFWDTYTGLESKGQVLPKNTWTLHGLWPDFCNGSFTQYCDLKFVSFPHPLSLTVFEAELPPLSRQYDPVPSPNTTTGTSPGTSVPPYTGPSISSFLAPLGKLDLLAYMNKYWISQGSPNGDFWGHEFSKHATCFSSFDLPCYGPSYTNHSDVVDFFQTAVQYYANLPTYGWLSAAGIRPSNATRVSLTDLQSALTKGFGALPYIGCSGPRYNTTEAGKGSLDNGFTQLSEVWYYYHVYGRVQRSQGLPVNASINGGSVSSCAKASGALLYPLRAVGSDA
jgi:ribonuclease T2